MFVKWIATLIVAVNANSRAGEVAAGVSFALLLAPLTDGLLHRLGRIADTQKQATDAVKSQLESQLEKLPLPKLKF